MGKHRKHDMEGDLFDGEGALKPQLSEKVEPGEHIPESSQSPIETF